MPATAAEMLKATEAAVVARVSLRDVNRVIDEHILPEALFSIDDGRHVRAAACSLIAFYFEGAKRLTADERLFAIRETWRRLMNAGDRPLRALLVEDWTVRDEFLSVDLAPFIRRTAERMERLAAAKAMVESVPDILGGTPVIRGTRIPVHDVAALAARPGMTRERLLDAYPGLDAEKIELALLYAEANPARGRPRAPELPKGAVVVTDRRVPRRMRRA